MTYTLVLADRIDGAVTKTTLEMLTIAREHGTPVVVLTGPGAADDVARVAEFGAGIVLLDPSAESEPVVRDVDLLEHAAREYSPTLVLTASTTSGKETAARLAVRLNTGVVTDAIAINADLTVAQPIFGGAVMVNTAVKGVTVATIRPSSVAAVTAPASPEVLSPEVRAPQRRMAVISASVPGQRSTRPDLAAAEVVVSGGRGLGAAESFAMVEELADLLGGAVGASRAATDAGWYPHRFQVGQTGVTVSPQVYIALGISGAIQHRAGMQTSKAVVVVNKDREAPLFALADFGIVGDVTTVVPAILTEIKRRRT